MNKMMIPLLTVGLLCAGAETSFAQKHGLSTVSGKRFTVFYSSPVKINATGERCVSTVCGRSTTQAAARQRAAAAQRQAAQQEARAQDTEAQTPSTRLGDPMCNSTYCYPHRP